MRLANQILPRTMSNPSSQFSGVKMYLFKDTLIWKSSLSINITKRIVKIVHRDEAPIANTTTIIMPIVQSSQDPIKTNLNTSQGDPQPCLMSLIQSLIISSS